MAVDINGRHELRKNRYTCMHIKVIACHALHVTHDHNILTSPSESCKSLSPFIAEPGMVVNPTLSPTMPASLNAAPVTQPVDPVQPAAAKVRGSQ